MDPVNRRSFLVRGTVVAGAAAAGGVGIVTGATSAGAAPLTADELAAIDLPVLLHVRDAATGEVGVLVGEDEIVFTDKSLVAKVLRARK